MRRKLESDLTCDPFLQAFRMDPFTANNSADQIKKGVIPNKARAEEIATRQFNAAKKVRHRVNE